MGGGLKILSRRHREGFFSLLSVGFFFLVIGAIFLMIPGLFGGFVSFFTGFHITKVPNTRYIYLPEPVNPADHIMLYRGILTFCVAWGGFQVVLFLLRILAGSRLEKQAETLSDSVFWLGASFLVHKFLIQTTVWFVFWAAIIILCGLTLILRAVVLMTSR